MSLPEILQQVLDEALDSVQRHPTGELTQDNRRIIYDTLWAESVPACQWTAILTARHVQPIYETKWADLMLEPVNKQNGLPSANMRFIIRSVANGFFSTLENLYYQTPDAYRSYAQRMLDIAEDVMLGLLISEYATQAVSGYYYEVMTQMIRSEPSDAYFALWAAYQALCTVAGTKPLQNLVGISDPHFNRGESIIWSNKWDDLTLVQDGDYAADFAVYAAFANAYIPDPPFYRTDKMRDFWTWWLVQVIPQAWNKAAAP